MKFLAQVHLYISYLLLHLGHVSQAIEHSELALDLVESVLVDRDNITPELTRLYTDITHMILGLYSTLTLYIDI